MPSRNYIPAFHFHWLTPWYDRFMARLYPEGVIRGDLIANAALRPGQCVLDMGCGTGTLALMLAQQPSMVEVHGLDVDAKVLAIAQRKAQQAGVGIHFEQGSAASLPYDDASFDRVFASLMLHHLKREDKHQALSEVFRILKPGGELHVVDFGPPAGRVALWLSWITRCFEEIGDNVRGLLPHFMAKAGFQVVETGFYDTVSGTLRSYRACKAGEPMGVDS